jgi:DNA-directed RNA polymerase subunit RPC12/RpoP
MACSQSSPKTNGGSATPILKHRYFCGLCGFEWKMRPPDLYVDHRGLECPYCGESRETINQTVANRLQGLDVTLQDIDRAYGLWPLAYYILLADLSVLAFVLLLYAIGWLPP